MVVVVVLRMKAYAQCQAGVKPGWPDPRLARQATAAAPWRSGATAAPKARLTTSATMAATTGIIGASVVLLALLGLPVMLNQGYGWASNVNLQMIFDALFSVESGIGYPPHRQESQKQSRMTLSRVSDVVHCEMADIVKSLPEEITNTTLRYPGIFDALGFDQLPDSPLKQAINKWR